jgi:hypothetical protein
MKMLVTTEDVAKATGITRASVVLRLRASGGKVECAKIGGKYLLSSETFPPVLRTVIEGHAMARKKMEDETRNVKAMKRRMYHWLYRHPGKTADDWRKITHAQNGKIRGSEQVTELVKLARIGRKAKAARAAARKEAQNEAVRNRSYAVVIANAAERSDPGPDCSSGNVRSSAPWSAGGQEGA